MAVNLSPVGGVAAQFFDNSGNVLTGGKLYTYAAGTTTPAVTYTTNSGLTPNSNPIILDAAGRVPNSGEIWLTDGISYKFILKDSNDVQIASWDNIIGINSNFLAYALQDEVQTATQGQTVFTLTDVTYQPATNSLAVFVNGSRQIVTLNYAETSSTSVTFVDGLNVGDVVGFITAISDATNAIDAAQVGYNEGGAGAVDTNVQAKLQEIISITDFGAIGDGVTDDTDAWNYFVSAVGLKLIPPGEYLVNGVIKNYISGVYLHQNVDDYATLGPNLMPAFAALTKSNFNASGVHAAGTIGTLTGTMTGNPYGYYLMKIVVTTTTPGYISLLKSGVTIFGDLPEYYFSDATILLDALENNRILTSTDYYFYLSNSTTGFSNISIQTDTVWAGTVSALEVYAIDATAFSFAGTGSESNALENPLGLKVTGINRNDLVLGNKEALGAYQYDGIFPTPSSNVSIGSYALASNQHGDENVALGSYALAYNEGSDNTGLGYSALKFNTKGQENTAVGYKAGANNTTGFRNTFIGFWSGTYNRTGTYNTRVGWAPNIESGISSGDTSVGAPCGTAVLSGGENCFFGSAAGTTVTGQSTLALSGAIGVGYAAKPWGDYSIAIGHTAHVGTEGTFADASIAIGHNSDVTQADSIAIGNSATVDTGFRGIAIGVSATSSSTDRGTAVGWSAKAQGQYTTAIGGSAGIQMTGAQNTFLGVSAGNISTNSYTNCTLLGYATDVTGNNQVQLGDSLTTTYAYGAVQNRSDIRDKADIRDTILGLDFINGLRPVDFKWDYRKAYREIDADGNVIDLPKDGSKKRNRYHHGLIAQEVKAVVDVLGADFGGFQDHSITGGEDVLSIGYGELIAPMIKAIQELKAEIDALKAAK